MTLSSLLQELRRQYKPAIPSFLKDLNYIRAFEREKISLDSELQSIFPCLGDQWLLSFEKQEGIVSSTPLKVGVLFSGGQAAGGHNVIAGLWDALKAYHASSELIGFLGGPSGLLKNQHIQITNDHIDHYRNQGGFDLLGSGRTKIQTEDQFRVVAETVIRQKLDGLVIIGGDDSNTNAAFLAEYFLRHGISTRVIGVPKTIDGDLSNEYIETSFGFDSAAKTFSETIGNLSLDALSAKKYWFFVKIMGRSASHLTLECALQTQPNLALISEEITALELSLQEVVARIADVISRRAKIGKNYGVILIPEGLIEAIPEFRQLIHELNVLMEKYSGDTVHIENFLSPTAISCFNQIPEDLRLQFILDRDSHGNVQVSKIETERLLITLVDKELKTRSKEGSFQGEFYSQPYFCGYEGRCCLPSNFDCDYAYSLGLVAALLIREGKTGYMASICHLARPSQDWTGTGVPLTYLMQFEERAGNKKAVIAKSYVDLSGPLFLKFAGLRSHWIEEDSYLCPGPIQFNGPYEITHSISETLKYICSVPKCEKVF